MSAAQTRCSCAFTIQVWVRRIILPSHNCYEILKSLCMTSILTDVAKLSLKGGNGVPFLTKMTRELSTDTTKITNIARDILVPIQQKSQILHETSNKLLLDWSISQDPALQLTDNHLITSLSPCPSFALISSTVIGWGAVETTSSNRSRYRSSPRGMDRGRSLKYGNEQTTS